MLAPKQSESKTSGANAKQTPPKRGGDDVLQFNPAWQALALTPLGGQGKLVVSQRDDPYEREADHVADRVMRMADASPSVPKLSFPRATHDGVQLKCDGCADEDGEKLPRKERDGADASAITTPVICAALNSPSQPLDAGTRAFLEPRFGQDYA